jgi:glycosyltransferase involved in cell wall biosynthesis
MSNSLMEAMSLGRCIVATRVGAAPDLLEDGVHALLCQPTVPDLAAAMGRALGDPALRDRLGRAAKLRAGDFSVDRIASEFDTILRNVVQPGPIGG